MSVIDQEPWLAAQRANVANLFVLTNKAFEGFHKLTELNLEATKSTIAESQDCLQQAVAGKDLRDLFAMQASLAQSAAEKAISYSRQVYDIVTDTQAEIGKVAQAQYEQHSRNAQGLLDNFVKNAPAGSEAATALLQSAFSAAQGSYESVQQAARQAVEVARTNFDAAANAASEAAQQADARAPRTAKR